MQTVSHLTRGKVNQGKNSKPVSPYLHTHGDLQQWEKTGYGAGTH